MAANRRITRTLALIAGLEGLALVAYAFVDVVGAALIGTTGPQEVSNASALTLQIVIFAVFGVGMLLVARGWLLGSRWVRGAFVLAQLIALVVGVPLIGATGSVERLAGVGITVLAVVGLLLVFSPSVTKSFAEDV